MWGKNRMPEFKDEEEVYDWIIENVTQNDVRYYPFLEEIAPLISFIYNKGISIEERNLPKIEKPSQEEINKIKEPQKYYKYIALKLIELENININKINFESTFQGRRVDVYVASDNKIILIECCSCGVPKVINYLENEDVELWIIKKGKFPWKDYVESEESRLIIFKRGENWKENYEKYKFYREARFKDIQEAYEKVIKEMYKK